MIKNISMVAMLSAPRILDLISTYTIIVVTCFTAKKKKELHVYISWMLPETYIGIET